MLLSLFGIGQTEFIILVGVLVLIFAAHQIGKRFNI